MYRTIVLTASTGATQGRGYGEAGQVKVYCVLVMQVVSPGLIEAVPGT